MCTERRIRIRFAKFERHLPLKSPVSATTTVYFLSCSSADSIFRRLSGETDMMTEKTELLYEPTNTVSTVSQRERERSGEQEIFNACAHTAGTIWKRLGGGAKLQLLLARPSGRGLSYSHRMLAQVQFIGTYTNCFARKEKRTLKIILTLRHVYISFYRSIAVSTLLIISHSHINRE